MLLVPVIAVTALYYVFGIFFRLSLAVYAVYVITFLSLVYIVLRIAREKELLKLIFTPGFLAFGIFVIIVFFAQRNRMLENWDEFAHWGRSVKNMKYLDIMPNMEGATTNPKFRGYPPGTALLQYFFTSLAGGYAEGNLLRAMNILYAAFAIPVFGKLEWKKPGQFIVMLLVILILPTVFYTDFYVTLYVDGILGICLGYILYIYFSAKEYTGLLFLKIGMAMFFLTVTK